MAFSRYHISSLTESTLFCKNNAEVSKCEQVEGKVWVLCNVLHLLATYLENAIWWNLKLVIHSKPMSVENAFYLFKYIKKCIIWNNMLGLSNSGLCKNHPLSVSENYLNLNIWLILNGCEKTNFYKLFYQPNSNYNKIINWKIQFFCLWFLDTKHSFFIWKKQMLGLS